MSPFEEAIKRAKAYYCLDCGKCTSVCPISRLDPDYSPRRTVQRALSGDEGELLRDGLLWSCLTCKLCNERCESDVLYSELIRDLRIEAHRIGEEGLCSHSGAIQSLMRIMAAPKLEQNRLDWIPRGLKISDQGEYLYFVGCLPYFDAFFTDLDLNTLDIAKSTIKLLNHLGIEPVLAGNERCCGHDLLWTGDIDNFRKLAQHNIEEIRRTGAKKLIASCPECYRTLKVDYPRYVGSLGVEVIHISQFLAEKISEGRLKLRSLNRRVTYQDPCRLGRFSSIYDEPRQMMGAIEELELKEMGKSGKTSVCCGTSAWMGCSSLSKQIQVARLKEAKSTGADLLITACPKCEIHFRCTMNDEKAGEEVRIEIKDLVSLIAGQLPKKQSKRRST